MQESTPKKNWSITSSAFARLLSWLDDGVDSDGRVYLEMRERLVVYFDRKNCRNPDDLADETLNRVTRRLEEEGGVIEGEAPARFLYITARFVFLENLRSADRASVSLDDAPRDTSASTVGAANEENEKRLHCLDRCVAELDRPNQSLIMRYYHGEESVKIGNRRRLAAELNISANALTIRACRLRERLETCVRKCVGNG